MRSLLALLSLAAISCGESREPTLIDKNFYRPTPADDRSPEGRGWKSDDVTFSSEDGTKLHGWFIDAAGSAKGTVVYAHGVQGWIGDYMAATEWMRDAGWNVFLFDYRGYGRSEGAPSRVGVVEDTQAAIKYLLEEREVPASKLIAAGYSLGGATVISAVGRMDIELPMVVSVASFSSYKSIISELAGKEAAFLDRDGYSAKRDIKKIPAATEVFIVHGGNDTFVRPSHARTLAKARPEATLSIIDGGSHRNPFGSNAKAELRKLEARMSKAVDAP